MKRAIQNMAGILIFFKQIYIIKFNKGKTDFKNIVVQICGGSNINYEQLSKFKTIFEVK